MASHCGEEAAMHGMARVSLVKFELLQIACSNIFLCQLWMLNVDKRLVLISGCCVDSVIWLYISCSFEGKLFPCIICTLLTKSGEHSHYFVLFCFVTDTWNLHCLLCSDFCGSKVGIWFTIIIQTLCFWVVRHVIMLPYKAFLLFWMSLLNSSIVTCRFIHMYITC
jgi:hypothetical protein